MTTLVKRKIVKAVWHNFAVKKLCYNIYIVNLKVSVKLFKLQVLHEIVMLDLYRAICYLYVYVRLCSEEFFQLGVTGDWKIIDLERLQVLTGPKLCVVLAGYKVAEGDNRWLLGPGCRGASHITVRRRKGPRDDHPVGCAAQRYCILFTKVYSLYRMRI